MATLIQSGGLTLLNEPISHVPQTAAPQKPGLGERSVLDVPSKFPVLGVKPPRVEGGLVLNFYFDGVLHHENVFWHPRRGAYAGPPGLTLSEHAALLDELLAPIPEVGIVLSTSWGRQYGCYGAAQKRLPGTSPNTSSFQGSGSSLSTSRLLLEFVPQRFGEYSGYRR